MREELGEGITLYADLNETGDALNFTTEPPAKREPAKAESSAE